MSEPLELGPTPGRVIDPNVDPIIDAIEAEQDAVAARRRLFEGVPQTEAELERWRGLFTTILRLSNEHLLSHGVQLVTCSVNPSGWGAVFVGKDRYGDQIHATFTLPREVLRSYGQEGFVVLRRDAHEAADEKFVRFAVDQVVSGVLDEYRAHLARGRVVLQSKPAAPAAGRLVKLR